MCENFVEAAGMKILTILWQKFQNPSKCIQLQCIMKHADMLTCVRLKGACDDVTYIKYHKVFVPEQTCASFSCLLLELKGACDDVTYIMYHEVFVPVLSCLLLECWHIWNSSIKFAKAYFIISMQSVGWGWLCGSSSRKWCFLHHNQCPDNSQPNSGERTTPPPHHSHHPPTLGCVCREPPGGRSWVQWYSQPLC